MKKVAVVVLHYKGKKLTLQCLESVGKLKTRGFETMIFLIDNHSPEPVGKLPKEYRGVYLVKNKENLGFAEGNNVGIQRALQQGADYVLLLNNDTIVDKHFLVYLFNQAGADPKIGILGPKIYFAPGYEYHREKYKPGQRGKVIWFAGGLIDWQNVLGSHRGVDEVDQGQYDKVEKTDFISGCALFVRREVFEKVGLLDKKYYLYLEDLDFCQKAKKSGFGICYVPKARLWHANAGSSVVGGDLHDYYFTRNRLLFGMRYAPLRTKLALVRESLKLLFFGRQWQKIGIRDFYKGKFNQGSYRS